MTVAEISPVRLAERARTQKIDLFDVRTPAEFTEIHAQNARNLPLDELDLAKVQGMRTAPGEAIYFICRSGSRGKKACEKLLAAGVTDVVNVEGGTLAWEQAGLPVLRGRKAISLERQVRIAAGTLVLLGVALGFVHPLFFGLAAFVGAGLVFAGVTDTCGMAMLLAKMPWNRRSEATGQSSQQTCQVVASVPGREANAKS